MKFSWGFTIQFGLFKSYTAYKEPIRIGIIITGKCEKTSIDKRVVACGMNWELYWLVHSLMWVNPGKRCHYDIRKLIVNLYWLHIHPFVTCIWHHANQLIRLEFVYQYILNLARLKSIWAAFSFTPVYFGHS